MTDPPGRPLSSTGPGDAAARRAWMNAYQKAGGRVVTAAGGSKLGAPVALCKDPWVEFRYRHCDGSPVAGARYTVRAGDVSISGTLDDDGFARVEGLPKGTTHVTYAFAEDPGKYIPQPPAASVDTPASRFEVGQVFDEALQWAWGTIQGDFNPDPSLSQIAVNTVVGLIPIADQVLDARDLVAGIKHLVEFYSEDEEQQRAHAELLGLSYETWLWVGVFLTAMGCIPEFGSAVKGVVKALLHELRELGHLAKELGGSQLRRIWEALVAALNFLGKQQGNAHRWLKDLPGRLSGHMDDAAKRIKDAAEAFRRLLQDAEVSLRLLKASAPEWAKKVAAALGKAKAAIGKVFERLEHQKQRINTWLREQLEHVLGKRGASEGAGAVNTHVPHETPEPHPTPGGPGSGGSPPAGGPNEVVQPAAPPPEPALPPQSSKPLTGAERAELGVRREQRVADLVGGKVSRQKIKTKFGGSDLDVIGPKGEFIAVGGPKKAEDLGKLGHQLKVLSEAAKEQGVPAMAAFERGTPQTAIDLAIKKLGAENVFIFDP